MSSEGEPGRKDDVVFVHSKVESGDGFRVIRKREGVIEVGEIRPVQEGKPLTGEMVKLSPRSDHEQIFDVEVLVSKEQVQGSAARSLSGPAQVATAAYRSNWDAIFGASAEADPEPDPSSLN
jgi:hypothetical protein